MTQVFELVQSLVTQGLELVKENRWAKVGLVVGGVMTARAIWLSIGDRKIHSKPQKDFKKLMSVRPRGMRLGDWPEYIISVGLLSTVAKYANVPTNVILGGISLAFSGALFLHRPVQRFRYMWRLTFFVWSLVFGYSSLTQYFIPECHWSLIPCGYISSLVAFYLWHITAHQPFTGELYRVHMRHHMKIYPPNRFLSDKHLASHSFFSKDGFNHEGPLYTLIILELCLLRYLYPDSSKNAIYFLLFGLGIFGYLGNQLHYAFHIRGHFLENMEWFLMLRELHWIHHKGDMKKNFMLLNFSMDELFSSKDYIRYIQESNAGTKQPRIKNVKD